MCGWDLWYQIILWPLRSERGNRLMLIRDPSVGEYYDFIANEYSFTGWHTYIYRVIIVRRNIRSKTYTVRIVGVPAGDGNFNWMVGNQIVMSKSMLTEIPLPPRRTVYSDRLPDI